MQKTKTKLILSLAMVFIIALILGAVSALQTSGYAEADTSSAYYYNQLTSVEAKAVYNALADMRDDGVLKTGTNTWDLVEKGYLSNKEYDQDTLTAAFGAGKDAFMLDNPALFYIDFDKISLRSLTDGTNYKITLGIGREDDYLADGFTTGEIDAAISSFETEVTTIAVAANEKTTQEEKILYVYETVMDNAVYALEFDAGENADYVRCAYGVLVKGMGVCQSFSQAVKTILDEIGITSVLVQGTYIDDGAEQPHMWVQVKMDDNRWYILDATMDNAWRDSGTEDSLRYFLMTGADAAGLYCSNGVISTSGFEFEYPSLSMTAYEVPSSSFTFTEATTSGGTEYYKISYNGMGLRAAEEQGYYIIATYSVNEETSWFYVIRQMEFALKNSGGDIDDYDFDSYFSGQLLGSRTSYTLAVTTDAPDSSLSIDSFDYIYYTGSNIFDKSSTQNSDADTTRAPYALYVSPDCLRFYIGSSYSVTITFSDALEIVDASEDVTITFTLSKDNVTLNDEAAVITNVNWSADNPTQVTFTFTPDKNYSADRLGYILTVNNLVGEKSSKAPATTTLTALYKPSFSCPMDPLSYSTVVASVPALISDSDLSTEGWKYTDSNGNEKTVDSSSLGAKISLVATTYSDEDNTEYQSAVEDYIADTGDGTEILKSETYDLSLNLCDVQVNYLNGTKVMIMVPYPSGYSAASTGTSFKAYHFGDNGVEEIDCYCTEYGIILFCSSFSAYTIAAVKGSADTAAKNVLITTEGSGSAEGGNLVTVAEGEKLSVKLTADDGYCVDSITINGKTYSLNGAAEYELEMEYSELDANTTVIVKFASAAVVKSELAAGYSLASAELAEGLESSNITALIIVIIAIVVVLAAIAVVAVILKKRSKNKKA